MDFPLHILASARAILNSGQELLPVLFLHGEEGLTVVSLPPRKEVWSLVIRDLRNQKDPDEMAFVCSARSRTLAPNEGFPDVRPMDDPRAEDTAIMVLAVRGEPLRVWECKYDLTSNGVVTNIGPWKELPGPITDRFFDPWD